MPFTRPYFEQNLDRDPLVYRNLDREHQEPIREFVSPKHPPRQLLNGRSFSLSGALRLRPNDMDLGF